MAFDGVLPPESASFAGGSYFQAPGIAEHPGTPPAPIPLSETAGLAACGETGVASPDREPLDRGALGRSRNSVAANRPSTCTPLARRAAAPCERGRKWRERPFSVPESGTGMWRNLHWRRTPWEGRSCPNYPAGRRIDWSAATTRERSPELPRFGLMGLEEIPDPLPRQDMRLAGYRRHRLKGDRPGQWSACVSGNWWLELPYPVQNRDSSPCQTVSVTSPQRWQCWGPGRLRISRKRAESGISPGLSPPSTMSSLSQNPGSPTRSTSSSHGCN